MRGIALLPPACADSLLLEHSLLRSPSSLLARTIRQAKPEILHDISNKQHIISTSTANASRNTNSRSSKPRDSHGQAKKAESKQNCEGGNRATGSDRRRDKAPSLTGRDSRV